MIGPRLLVLALAIALTNGCSATSAPLTNFSPGDRDRAKFDSDKADCWNAAEAASGGLHSRTRWMMAPPIYSAVKQGSAAEQDAQIEGAAEACMVQRGYTILKP
jgi:hypothetical protein